MAQALHAKTHAPSSINRDTVAHQNMVSTALAANKLHLALQPVVMSDNPDRIAFQEALARIEDADGRIIAAGEFIEAIEDHHLGRMLDCAVLQQAVAILAENVGMRLSINLSAKSVGNREWLRILEEACAATPTCGELLIVEITETAFLDLSPEAIDFLTTIRALGCSIAIDDFGAGNTSIAQLGRFRFDFLKIDRQFMTDFATNPTSRYLVEWMANMAKRLEMVSVVEGVEDSADRETLEQLGVDCIQGYAFGRPSLYQ